MANPVATFTLSLNQPAETLVVAKWRTQDGTAIAGIDYIAATGQVEFLPGELEKHVDVQVIPPAAGSEKKYFTVEITDLIGADNSSAAPGPVVVGPESVFRGPPGRDGKNGTNGARGADGADGADGVDAYQVAVLNGFVGSEAAWLASLRGEPGPAGADGADGIDGTNGARWYTSASAPAAGIGSIGDFYLNGANGDVYGPKSGSGWGDPVANLTGPAGAPGQDGADGSDGADGASGGGGTGSANLLAVTTAAFANQQTAIAEICSVPVEAGHAYAVRFLCMVRPSDPSKGLAFGITGSFGSQTIQMRGNYPETSAGVTSKAIHDKATIIAFASSEAGNEGNLFKFEGIVHVISAGTFGVGYAVANQYDYQEIVRGACLILEPLGAVPTN